MGLLDALLGDNSGSGLLGGLPQSWQYPTAAPDAAEEKRKQDAAFMASINQDPNAGGFNPGPSGAGPFTPGAPTLGTMPGQYGGSTPFGLGGLNLPQTMAPQGAPASGAFPAVPPAPIFAPQPPVAPVAATPPAIPTTVPAGPAGPINTMDIGGYQMPQYGSAADYTPSAQPAAPAVRNAMAQAPATAPEQLPQALGGRPSGMLDRINTGLQSLGHGGSIIGALTGNRTDPQSIGQQNLAAQYHSVRQTLIDNGEAPDKAASKAMLAVLNPEAGKTILAEALTNKEKYQKTGTDAFGGGGFLAPGVKGIDSTLKGNDYLSQFSPEVKAAVQDYVDGKSMPTGNPRKGFTQTVKMIAQKYGADTGQSVDDATYSARRTMRNQLSSSAPSSLGGQINIGNTAAGHLADLTQKALELGNVDTGIAPLTAAVNGVRGLGTEQAAKMEALKGAAQHYGQEITKFYAGSPGGTAERDRFIESVNGARSPKELAAILSTEGELMRSRLDALGDQIKGVLGDEGAKQYPVLRPDGEAALAKVETNVSKLKGGQSAATSTPTIQEGATATNQKTGQKITFINGKWQ